MTDEPHKILDDIEAVKGFEDIGRMGVSIFRGAINEGATADEAIMVTSAVVTGFFMSARQLEKDEEDTT
jgi:hypothetical protein